MELRNYLKLIKKECELILTIAAITAASAFAFSIFQPLEYESSFSLSIDRDGTQETLDFKYDGYYALQTAEIIAGSVEQWLKSPDVVNSIYQKAGIDPGLKSIKGYTKKFKAKKMSAQYVEVTYGTDTPDQAKKVASAITEILNLKTKNVGDTSKQEVSFAITGNDPIIAENKPDAAINFALGLVSGLILGVFVVFGREYFRNETR